MNGFLKTAPKGSHTRSPSGPGKWFTYLCTDQYERIERPIESDDTPVGIDAKEAHVVILHKLIELEKRLDRIERRLDA